MKKISFVVQPFYQNNKIFDLSDDIVNRDNCMYPFYLLKERFKEVGYNLSTQDINSIEDSTVVLYNEMPKDIPLQKDKNKSYLLLFESELIRPDNWDTNKHQYFNKIFTWKDDIVDDIKYIKFNFAQEIPKKIDKDINKKEKLCTLIAGNKKNSHPLELYSKRVEAIQWFEKYHPNDFDFYGIGWDKYASSNRYLNTLLKKVPLSPIYKSYKGKVKNKNNTLKKYKFAICYENARDISGYITEKIFDCFFATCVPVYWGADNISEHIPKECFIDKHEFTSYEELYTYMINMPEEEYMEYLNNIEKYLQSEKVYEYSSDFFAKRLMESII